MAVNIKKEFPQRKPDLTPFMYGKVPPQALELEEAVLAACMLESDTFQDVLPILPSHECFYSDAHQKIWSAMIALFHSGSQVDLLTITDALRKAENLEIVGGAHYLTRLTMAVVSGAHAKAHASIVREKFMYRELIRIAGSVISDAYKESTDVFDLLEKAEKEIQEITAGIGGENSTTVGEIYMEVLMDIEALQDNPTGLIGIDTGYRELNEIVRGWQLGDIILVCARPSQGKTAIAINFAENAVTSEMAPAGEVLIISLETKKKNLVRRLAAAKNNIPLEGIITGKLTTSQQYKMEQAVSAFHKLPIKINDYSQTLQSLISTIRNAYKKYMKNPKYKIDRNGVKTILPFLVIIDYVQLVKNKAKGNREQELAEISNDLKRLAMELDIAIIELCQLNRDVERRTIKRPMLADIRESGAIEQDANVALLIYHEDKGEHEPKDTWLIVAKNKDGKCEDVRLNFAGDIQRWKSYDSLEKVEQASFLSNFQSDNPYKGIHKEESWEDC